LSNITFCGIFSFMPSSSEAPKGPYFPGQDPDPEFDRYLAGLKPEDEVQGVPTEAYKEWVGQHQALMFEMASEADPRPVLERWDNMVEGLQDETGTRGADLWNYAKYGVCLWLWYHPSLDHRELALDRARSIFEPKLFAEALLLMNDGDDKRGMNYLAYLLTHKEVHPFEQEMTRQALAIAADESQVVGELAKAVLVSYEEHASRETAQRAASEQERLELSAEEFGVPLDQISLDRRYRKLDVEYRKTDEESLPEDHPARPLFEAGVTGIRVKVFEEREFDDQGNRWVERRKHAVQLIQRLVRQIESSAIDLTKAEEVLEIAEQTLLERLNNHPWQAVQTSGRPAGDHGDGWRSWHSLEESASNALRYRDDLYREHRYHSVADVSDALNQDFIDRADRFYEFTDQIARRLLEPKSED
jgi:hypothetical protein